MGKKKMAVMGTENEETVKKKATVKREQKKLRKGDKPAEAAVVEAGASAAPAPVEKSVKKARIRSKNYQALKAKVKVDQTYSLSNAIKLLRDVSYSKFDPTVELHISLKEKTNKEIDLPHATGKIKKVVVATDEIIAKIAANQIDFDVLLASPDQMPKLVKFAKVLGPRGLMPNPKNGTVVPSPEKTAKDMSGKNALTLKTEKDAPLLHLVIGKLSMSDQDLSDNISAVTSAISPQVTKIVLKSTMSPAIKLTV